MSVGSSRPGFRWIRGEAHVGARPWISALVLVFLGIGTQGPIVGPAAAQDEVKNYKKPILTVETGGHHGRVRSLLWQDASTLSSGGEDKVVKVWDFQNGATAGTLVATSHLARTKRDDLRHGDDQTGCAGAIISGSGGLRGRTRRGDLTIFRVPGIERGPRGEGRIPSGEVVARLVSPPEGQPNQIGHRNSVLSLAFDPAGGILASGSKDTTVILWDVPAFRPRALLPGHTGDVLTLAFSPNGQRLATGSADGSLRLWNVANGVQVDIQAGNPRLPGAHQYTGVQS